MQITGTFLDEISHDIPHQNWGPDEWALDLRAMRAIGMDTVILIRSGHRRWLTYPSDVLISREGCHRPPLDLVDLFLTKGILDLYAVMGRHCKAISGNLPVLISPWIDGVKSVNAFSADIQRSEGITLAEHEREWGEVMHGIRGAVDAVAFQDGHVDIHELPDFLAVNKALADQYGLRYWTNSETFDRDMPKFLPIKWDKLLLKLQAARQAGMEKAITFEFSHFLSPNSCYLQARHLFRRYCEHFGLRPQL